ncbi:MAG: hypothetical protein RIT19_2609, partial [Verrucomicrobiota bacterium]
MSSFALPVLAALISVVLPVSAQAQTRNRVVVGWGESLLGLNAAPTLPSGVSANDIDVLVSGDLVNAVGLRSGIAGYTGSRFILSGPGV